MGFDPILLLDEVPLNENYSIHIIRPGEDKNQIINEARENIINNDNKKRKKPNKNIVRLQNKLPIIQQTSNNEAIENIEDNHKEEITNDALDEDKNESINTDNNGIEENQESNSLNLEETNEDPRRKRRRSSASS